MKISSGGNGNKNAIFVDAGTHFFPFKNNDAIIEYYIFWWTGIHAREWIAPATWVFHHQERCFFLKPNLFENILTIQYSVTYIIRELVENYTAHPQYVDDVDWYFMPLINPDGYEFSHTNVFYNTI